MDASIDRYIQSKLSVLKRSKHSLRPHKSFSKKSKSMKTIRKAKSLSARTERNLYERHAILMVGIPGSGKSGTKTKCIRQFPGVHFVNIDVDEFLEKFYKNDRTQYAAVYPLFNRLLKSTIEKGLNLVIDGTGRDLHATIDRLHNAHYSVNLCINLVNLEVSRERARERAERTGRQVNEAYIQQVAESLKKNIPLYLENPKVNEVFVYSNNGNNQQRQFICKKSSGCDISEVLQLLE